MRLLPSIAIALMTVLLSCNIHAQEDTDWYAGVGVGQSNVDLDKSFWSDNSIVDDSLKTDGFNYQVYGGYRFNRYIALEGGYLDIADTVYTGVSNGFNSLWNAGNVEGITRIDGMMLQAVGFIPTGITRLKPYIKGGVFFVNTLAVHDSTINDIIRFHDDGVTFIGGAGLQLQFWEKWHLRAEAQYTIVPLENRQNVAITFATLGLMYSIN